MFQIDLMSRTPVYEQIIEQLENLVIKGLLDTNSQIPSVRSLSLKLSINPNTI
jgi:GntR family transcriptional regulator